MADSNITKRALASALRELMDEVPFEKIQVSHICERCGMNRKSFYYHFKDKYDLLNWIFDVDFITFTKNHKCDADGDERIEQIKEFCDCFYKNRNFYRKALKIEGQNSLSEHLQEICFPLLKDRLIYLFGDDAVDDFEANFLTDACICAIKRWILDPDCMPPDQLVDRMVRLIRNGVEAAQRKVSE